MLANPYYVQRTETWKFSVFQTHSCGSFPSIQWLRNTELLNLASAFLGAEAAQLANTNLDTKGAQGKLRQCLWESRVQPQGQNKRGKSYNETAACQYMAVSHCITAGVDRSGGTENLQQSWRLGQGLDTDKGNTPDGSNPCKQEEVEKQWVQTLNQQSKGLGIWYSVMQAEPASCINSSHCPNPW